MSSDKLQATYISRQDTSDTLLPDCSIKPDITLLCELCHDYIDICSLPYHRMYHEGLATLNYSHSSEPTDLKSLLQRSIILKKIRASTDNEKQVCCENVRKVDTAYEEVKNYIEDINFPDGKLETSVKGLALSCSCDCVYAVGICSSENLRWKSCMEDYSVYQDYFGEDENKSYFAIFDGHHGANAAEKSSQKLHEILLCEMAKFDPRIKSTTARNFVESAAARQVYEELRPKTRNCFIANLHQKSIEIVQNILNLCFEKYDKIRLKSGTVKETKMKKRTYPLTEQIHSAFQSVYLLTDIFLSNGEGEISKVRWSGTSALTVIIQNVQSEIDDNASTLREEFTDCGHKSGRKSAVDEPSKVSGFIHVANAGGSFSTNDRDTKVNGVLSTTRGLGNLGDKQLKDCIIVKPSLRTVPIEQHAQLLVLASNGVWQVLSDEEVAALLVKMLPDQKIPPPSRASESLVSLLQNQHTHTSRASSIKLETDLTLREGQEPIGSLLQRHSYLSENDQQSGSDISQPGSQQFNQGYITSDKNADFKEFIEVTGEDLRKELAKSMAEQLTQAALMAGAKENISVIVVLLSACKL